MQLIKNVAKIATFAKLKQQKGGEKKNEKTKILKRNWR